MGRSRRDPAMSRGHGQNVSSSTMPAPISITSTRRRSASSSAPSGRTLRSSARPEGRAPLRHHVVVGPPDGGDPSGAPAVVGVLELTAEATGVQRDVLDRAPARRRQVGRSPGAADPPPGSGDPVEVGVGDQGHQGGQAQHGSAEERGCQHPGAHLWTVGRRSRGSKAFGHNGAHVSRADSACAAAPPLHRGRPPDPRGAQLLAPGQPLHPQPAGRPGRRTTRSG